MKVLIVMASKWEQNEATQEWRKVEWPCKVFYGRDKPYAELWVKLHMEGYEWSKEHNTDNFYSMCELELNYV